MTIPMVCRNLIGQGKCHMPEACPYIGAGKWVGEGL